jgi:hypothetical protein
MFRSRGNTHCVMAGLVPATHALLAAWLKQDVGARHKAGHDAERLCVNPSGISSRGALGVGRSHRLRKSCKNFVCSVAGKSSLPRSLREMHAQARLAIYLHSVVGSFE